LTGEIKNKDFKGIIDDYGISRIPVWLSSIEVIKENPLFGSGTGDVRLELNKKYKKYNLTTLLEKQLNAHNQYFETTIELGLPGFTLLFLLLLIPLIRSIKEKNVLLLFFVIITSYNFLFESGLNLSVGVVFFAFFYNFLIYINPSEEIRIQRIQN
jgi:O-antigen ligase